MNPTLRPRLELAAFLVVPILMMVNGGSESLGRATVDKSGHLWMGWHASQESPFYTELLAFPDGLDLMPVLGGWLDVLLVGVFSRFIALEPAYNLVLALYFLVAGLAGWALARALDAPRGALIAGLLLQLDGFVWMHMDGGRPEQVGLGFVALAAVALLELRRLPEDAAWWKAALLGCDGGIGALGELGALAAHGALHRIDAALCAQTRPSSRCWSRCGRRPGGARTLGALLPAAHLRGARDRRGPLLSGGR